MREGTCVDTSSEATDTHIRRRRILVSRRVNKTVLFIHPGCNTNV